MPEPTADCLGPNSLVQSTLFNTTFCNVDLPLNVGKSVRHETSALWGQDVTVNCIPFILPFAPLSLKFLKPQRLVQIAVPTPFSYNKKDVLAIGWLLGTVSLADLSAQIMAFPQNIRKKTRSNFAIRVGVRFSCKADPSLLD